MKKAKVVFMTSSGPPFQKMFWEYVPEGYEVVLIQTGASNEEEIVRQISDSDFLILHRSGVPEQALREAKNLKLIQLFTQGYDQVPVHLAAELGIPVSNFTGSTIAVAEHAVLLTLALLRRLIPSIKTLKDGKFTSDVNRTQYHELKNKIVGLVGIGNIGYHSARIFHGFDAGIIYYDKAQIDKSAIERISARPVELPDLLRESDIVSLHVPLLPSTRGIMGWEQLKSMKSSAILINTSRGELVDEEALIRALNEKIIAGAGLDVFTKEPPALDNPLLSMENVIATPHIGDAATENFYTRFNDAWGNISSVWQGQKPINVIKPMN
jgi:phosphoglycerate dehydrogenase-like enzyme